MKRPVSKGITGDWLASNRFLTTINRIMKVQADRETELNGQVIDVKLFHLQNKNIVISRLHEKGKVPENL